jgi:2,5-diketo-D-gluconate reductase B
MTTETLLQNKTSELFIKTFQSVDVPALGFGTYQLKGEDCSQSVSEALDLGYRHVDTARMYENEVEVGKGIRNSSIKREDIFLTSKIWMEHLEPDDLKRELQNSLRDLQTDYLDLLLIHWPNPEIPLTSTLDAMKEVKEKGFIRNIGVSNFPSAVLEQALEHAPVLCDQVEYHPLLSQDALLEVTAKHDLMLTAYSPLAQGEIKDADVLEDIGKPYGKSATQVGIRWLLEQPQVVAIPRSSKTEHIQQNFDVFDFELSKEDREKIGALPKDQRQINPDFAPEWDKS